MAKKSIKKCQDLTKAWGIVGGLGKLFLNFSFIWRDLTNFEPLHSFFFKWTRLQCSAEVFSYIRGSLKLQLKVTTECDLSFSIGTLDLQHNESFVTANLVLT